MRKKLSISQAWDEAREVLQRDGKLLAIVALALLVLPGTISNLLTPPPPGPGQLPEPGGWMAIWFIAALIGIVGQLALVRLAMAGPVTVGEAIGHGARRLPIYFGGHLLWVLPFAAVFVALAPAIQPPARSEAAAIAILFCMALFVFVFVRMMLAAPVASAEPVGPVAMLKRSWELTSGNWWRLFGFLVAFFLATLVVVLAVGAIFGLISQTLLGGTDGFSVGALLVALASQIVQAGAYTVLMVMLARLYLQRGVPEAQTTVPSSGT